MNNRPGRLLTLLLLWLVPCNQPLAGTRPPGTPATKRPGRIIPLPSPTAPTLPPGIEYVHRRSGDQPMSSHIVSIARTNTQFHPITTLAQQAVAGLETLSDQIRHLSRDAGRAVTGVNGDFFIIKPGPYQGDPRGLQIVRGELVSAPADTASFWIDPSGQPHLAVTTSRLHIAWPDGRTTPIGLNQERGPSTAVLYTPTFGPSTRTTNGIELVLARSGEGPWLPIRAHAVYRARVTSRSPHVNTVVPPGHMVLSLGPHLAGAAPDAAPGTTLEIHTDTTPSLEGVDQAISGGPILVRNGVVATWSPPQPRHPRTALGWNNTHFILVVVDGRQPGLSVGMSFPELAAFMRDLGCQEAVNLDGGGSSTLWLVDRVVNSPSDGHERSVANSLVWVVQE